MQEAPLVHGLTEDLRERWAQLAGSRRQLQSAEQTHRPAGLQADSETAPSGAGGDSQWTGGVDGPEVGRQHVFSAVEPVERGRRDAPWSQRAAGKTTSSVSQSCSCSRRCPHTHPVCDPVI